MSRKELRENRENDDIRDFSRKRITFGLALVTAALMLLVMRLFYIQIICQDEFSEAARSQYELRLTGLDSGAASSENTDDNGTTVFAVIAKDRNDAALERLLRASRAENITKASSRYDVYEIADAESDMLEKLRTVYDAYVFCSYRPEQSVVTMAGVNAHREIILYADAAGKIISGLPPKLRVSS